MLSDTISALKDVLLLTDKVDRLGNTLERFSDSLDKMADEINNQDKRLIRLETMVEIAQRNPAQERLD